MKIGFHINTHYGFLTTVEYAKQLGINFFQIFLTSPKNYNSKRHTDDELNQLRCKLLENSIGIVIHASYMLNFCNPSQCQGNKNFCQY
jgi:endonuclease IV